MKIIQYNIALFSILYTCSFSHVGYASQLLNDAILLNKEINEAAKQKRNNPVEYIFNKYKHSNNLITISINDKGINCAPENGYCDKIDIKTANLKKPQQLTDEQWQAFLKLTKDPIDYSYSGGGIDINFFKINTKGYIGLLIRVPNMGSAAGEQFLFYIFNKNSKSYRGLTDHDDTFFIGQKGDDNDIFFINFHENYYVIYRYNNDFSLYDFSLYNPHPSANNNNAIETLSFTYDYKYQIKKVLNKKQAIDTTGKTSLNEANMDVDQIIPAINQQLNKDYQAMDKDCPFDENYGKSSYVDQWKFSLKFQNICYYNEIICPLDDSISSCSLEVAPENENGDKGTKVFELEKKRYLRLPTHSNASEGKIKL